MISINPFLWFDSHAEEAMGLYTASFPQSSVLSLNRYPTAQADEPLYRFNGKVINGSFKLVGRQFMALDGGPAFKFTPSLSCFANLQSEAEIDTAWARLSEGGMVLMPLDNYPFSAKFGWLQDKFGLSWQLSLGAEATSVIPCLMFVGEQHGKAEEAINFYTRLFEDSGVDLLKHYDEQDSQPAGTLQFGHFHLAGQPFMALDSQEAHAFSFSEAFSFFVDCETQEEVDRLWSALSAHPQAEQCGWLKDKYGISWQIIPRALAQLMNGPDAEKTQRVMSAMLSMKKINIQALQAAYDGK
jgi:predicted 3-demethylubiquinone-9 3-methyltransferase (glyoxalase superfamily)